MTVRFRIWYQVKSGWVDSGITARAGDSEQALRFASEQAPGAPNQIALIDVHYHGVNGESTAFGTMPCKTCNGACCSECSSNSGACNHCF